MSRNLELKARVASLHDAISSARGAGAEFAGVLLQEDTSFEVRRGRLKLREEQGGRAELIFYERVETGSPRWSEYARHAVDQPASMKALLAAALGVRTVVRKERHLFLLPDVRIHLDDVQDLGQFIEFEIVDLDEAPSANLLESLRVRFGIRDEAVIPGSYADLVVSPAKFG